MFSEGEPVVDPRKVARQVTERVFEFVATFENYLEHVGDLEEWLEFTPKQLWKSIDSVAYMYSERFIGEHNLEKHSKLPSFPESIEGHQLLEALAFLLKVAWERGYLMYKFYEYDHVPPQTIQQIWAQLWIEWSQSKQMI